MLNACSWYGRAELADKVGLVQGLAEHHRADFAVSAPGNCPGRWAINTKKIRLTVQSTFCRIIRFVPNSMPIDALSNGRSEVMAGRLLQSFPLFGYDERLRLSFLMKILDLLGLVVERPRS